MAYIMEVGNFGHNKVVHGEGLKVNGSRGLDEPNDIDERIPRGYPQVSAELCVGRSERNVFKVESVEFRVERQPDKV